MKSKSYLSELHGYLMNNLSEHVTIEKAASIACVSKSKLKNDFRTEYGRPYYAYFRKKRMEKASEMLLTTDMKIVDISIFLGYDNCSKFAKAFGDVIGCSPSEYRKRNICNQNVINT